MIGVSSLARGITGGANGMATHAIGAGMSIGAEKMLGGKDMGSAIASGAFWYAADVVLPGSWMLPMVADGVTAGVTGFKDHQKYGAGRKEKLASANFGGNFQDTEQGYTMRQRSMQAINNSRMNARSILGSEARTLSHR